MSLRPVDACVQKELNGLLQSIEDKLKADLVTMVGPITYGVEVALKTVIEMKPKRRANVGIILDTPGGVVEVVERMVQTLRYHYPSGDLLFIIPNRAMSAGTVFVMAGDRILMDYSSCLGPIDPQIQKDGKLLPALSYLNQFERLNAKAQQGQLTSAEYALLNKLDLAELHQFGQARDLSKELLVKWLSTYKFKNWNETETQKKKVTPDMKQQRAEQVAEVLGNNERWHSHGRGIDLKTLQSDEINLRIEDYDQLSEAPKLGAIIRDYFGLATDFMQRQSFQSFLHTLEFF